MDYFKELVELHNELLEKERIEQEKEKEKQELIKAIERAALSLNLDAENHGVSLKVTTVRAPDGIDMFFDVFGRAINIHSAEIVFNLQLRENDNKIDLKKEIMDKVVLRYRGWE